MDLAEEVGYLKGMQAATQRELVDIRQDVSDVKTDVAAVKADVAEVTHDVAEVKNDVAEVNAKLDEVLAVMKGSGAHVSVRDQNIVTTILRNPATPVFAALVLVVVMALITISALSGRNANDLVPSMPVKSP